MKYLIALMVLAVSSVAVADEAALVIFGGQGATAAASGSQAGAQGGSGGIFGGLGLSRSDASSTNYSYGRNTTLPAGNFSSTGTVSKAAGTSTTQTQGLGIAQSVYNANSAGLGLADGQHSNVGLGVIVSPYPSVFSQ